MGNRIEIEEKVVKYFVRELKDRGIIHLLYKRNDPTSKLYQMFRGKGKKAKVFLSRETPFANCKTMSDIVNVVHRLNDEVEKHHGSFDPANVISMSINHLIHFFVEQELLVKGGHGNIEILNQFGQSIFDRTVSSLFGQERVDDYNNSVDNRDVIGDIKKKLWDIYMKGVASGEIAVSFDAFAKDNLEKLTKANPILEAMAQGQKAARHNNDVAKPIDSSMFIDPWDDGTGYDEEIDDEYDEWFDDVDDDGEPF